MVWLIAALAFAGPVAWDLGGETLEFVRDETRFIAVEDPGVIEGASIVHRSQCAPPTSSGPGAWVVTFESVRAARAFQATDPRACALLPYIPNGAHFYGLTPGVLLHLPADRPSQEALAFAAAQGLAVKSTQGGLAFARWEGVCGWEIADRNTRFARANGGRLTWAPDVWAETCAD